MTGDVELLSAAPVTRSVQWRCRRGPRLGPADGRAGCLIRRYRMGRPSETAAARLRSPLLAAAAGQPPGDKGQPGQTQPLHGHSRADDVRTPGIVSYLIVFPGGRTRNGTDMPTG